MVLSASTPIIKDGISYPHFTVNLAISPVISNSNVGATFALRLTPYRILESGEIELCPEETRAYAYADVFQTIAQGDSNLDAIANGIMEKIQNFILAKGI
jgi:hypothetical protein